MNGLAVSQEATRGEPPLSPSLRRAYRTALWSGLALCGLAFGAGCVPALLEARPRTPAENSVFLLAWVASATLLAVAAAIRRRAARRALDVPPQS